MENGKELVAIIGPTLCVGGSKPLAHCIDKACVLLRNEDVAMDEVSVTHAVYIPVAAELEKKLGATERAVYRAVETCWMNGKNDHLNDVIGRVLPRKPTPKEFILYCAYYLVHKVPYHQIKTNEAKNLPF